MGAVVLALAFSVVLAVIVWITIGARLRLNEDTRQNEILNVFAYVGIIFPVVFALVFFSFG